jgi:hypothetical protein
MLLKPESRSVGGIIGDVPRGWQLGFYTTTFRLTSLWFMPAFILSTEGPNQVKDR